MNGGETGINDNKLVFKKKSLIKIIVQITFANNQYCFYSILYLM